MKNKQSGFTLLELLVVIGIIAMLVGLVGPQVIKHLGASKTKTARIQIEELVSALDMYKLDTGQYPTSTQGLESLVVSPSEALNWNGPYLRKDKVPLDPWNNAYRYDIPGSHGDFDLYSFGLDKQEGGQGENQDIHNWD